MGIFYRQVGDQMDGGYRVRRSFVRWLASWVWRVRLGVALGIGELRRQPDVISALHRALRENEPQYLREWKAKDGVVGDAIDDLVEVMGLLRADKRYIESDRLRTIIGRLARSRVYRHDEVGLTRFETRSWR